MTSTTSRQLVITIHGIRDYGKWQTRFENLVKDCAAKDSTRDVTVENYHFGYFSVIAFLIPPLRWLVTRRFRSYLIRSTSKTSYDRIDMLGHSFGTHVLSWALLGIDEATRPQIHTVILAGSVLRSDFPWHELLGKHVRRVVNDCGAKDSVLLLSQFFVLFTGMAGRSGFSGGQHDGFRNRYSMFGHGGYFEDCDEYGSDDGYMARKWLPLIVSNDVTATWDDPRPKSVLSGVMATLGNNIEPVKIMLYATPLILALIWISGLYRAADDARAIAESGLLGAESANVLNQHPFAVSESASLATLSIKTALTSESRSAVMASLGLLPTIENVYDIDTYRPTAKYDQSSQTILLMGSSGGKSRVEAWNMQTGQRIYDRTLSSLCVTPDIDLSNGGTHAAVSCDQFGSHFVYIFSLLSEAPPLSIEITDYVDGVFFDSQAESLSIGTGNNLLVVDTTSGEIVTSREFDSRVLQAKASPTRTDFVVATENEVLLFDNWRKLVSARVAKIPEQKEVKSIHFSPTGEKVLLGLARTVSIDELVILQKHQDRNDLSYQSDGLTDAAAFSPDGRLIYTGSYNGEVLARRIEDGAATRFRVRHQGTNTLITGIEASADGRYVASVGADRIARLWDSLSGAEVSRSVQGIISSSSTRRAAKL